MSFEWLLGLRYTRSGKRRNRFISFISLISMAGIALGVAALIIVLSVMNGFQKEVRDRMLSVLAHIEVMQVSGGLPDWQAISKIVHQNKAVIGSAPYINAECMLSRAGVLKGALVRGILPEDESKVSHLEHQMIQGSLNTLVPDNFNIILGIELARSLGVFIGDKLTLIMPQGQMGPVGVIPRLKQFTVTGIFSAGHYEYDSTLAFIHLVDAQILLRQSSPAGLRLKVSHILDAHKVAQQLAATLPRAFIVRDWSQQNANWFAAVATEKRMMMIILTLIVAVAAFNLISTLVMTVTDKQADIAILRTLGASPQSIMKIFIIQGSLIGLLGTLLGIGFGVLVALNIDIIIPFIEQLFHIEFLPKSIYVISELPSHLHTTDVWIIGTIAMLLAFLATLYPSVWAASVKPAQALRYE